MNPNIPQMDDGHDDLNDHDDHDGLTQREEESRAQIDAMFTDIESAQNANGRDGGVEMEWSDDEEDGDGVGSSIFDWYKGGHTVTSKLPDRITNEQLVRDPFSFCGLRSGGLATRGGSGKRSKLKHTKCAWSEEETAAVIEGYRKYQQYANPRRGDRGIWSYIANDVELGKVLVNRKNQQIRDKWFHLVAKKDPRVRELVPQQSEDVEDGKTSPKQKKRMPKLTTHPVP